MCALDEIITSFFPSSLLRHIETDLHSDGHPWVEHHKFALLFADISDFTPITENMMKDGSIGAEKISYLLNTYFGQVIDLITSHGGDIVRIVGDALIALWLSLDEDLPISVCRALQCGTEIKSRFSNYRIRDDLYLSMRMHISAEEGFIASIVNPYGRSVYLVAGEPFKQIGKFDEETQSGDIILSSAAWKLVKDYCVGKLLPSGQAQLITFGKVLPYHALETPPISPEAKLTLRSYLPKVVLSHIDSGQTQWLAELRNITVMFIKLIGVDYNSSDLLTPLQDAIGSIQKALDHYEGCAIQFRADEKGFVIIAGFGLPPLTREVHAIRSAKAAASIQIGLNQLGYHSSIGIATGHTFCGPVGNSRRREYTIHGDTVNLAARLMQSAQEDEILCDSTTYEDAQQHIKFGKLPAFILKGKASPVTVYRVSEYLPINAINPPMIGRQEEQVVLAECIQNLKNGIGGVVLIEGEPGIGKTRLVNEFQSMLYGLNVRCLIESGDSIERSIPYQPWNSIFNQLFNLNNFPDPETKNMQVLRDLQDNPRMLNFSPLLNSVLPLNIPDNEITKQMVGEVRAYNIHEILSYLLQKKSDQEPLAIVLEDAHWLDSASWSLALHVTRNVNKLLMIVTSRPLIEPFPDEYTQIKNDSKTRHILLNALSGQESLAFASQLMGYRKISESVYSLIHNNSEGNPYFAEQYINTLLDSDIVAIDNGECIIISDLIAQDKLDLSKNIRDLVISRIDQLTMPQQLILKAASTIGTAFPYNILESIYPNESDKANLKDNLNILGRLGMITLESETNYRFKHSNIQELVYNWMLSDQRQSFHRAIAEWYESNHVDDLPRFYPILAHHWSKTEDITKAVYYLEKAGEQALSNFANEEAIGFFEQILKFDDNANIDIDRSRRAMLELKLGEAYVNQSSHVIGKEHLENGLEFLRMPVPRTLLSQVTKLIIQIIEQILFRAFSGYYTGKQSDRREILLAGSRAYEKLAEIYYYINETPLSLYSAFRISNLAELAGLSPELARGHSALGPLTGLIPLPKVAQSYCDSALYMAKKINDLPALEFVLMSVGYYYIAIGKWQESEKLFNNLIDIAKSLGDQRRLEDGIDNLMIGRYFQGYFASGLELSEDFYNSAKNRNDMYFQCRSLHGKIYCLLYLGKIEEAIYYMEELKDLIAKGFGSILNLDALNIAMYGLQSIIHLRCSEYQQAMEQAKNAENFLTGPFVNDYIAYSGYAGITEVYLTLWRMQYPEPEIDKLAKNACKIMDEYAKRYPIVRPRLWLHQGTYYWLKNKPLEAHKAWTKSLEIAEQLGMLYDKACAHYNISLHLPDKDPMRQEHLNQAVKIFTQLDIVYELRRIQETLTR